MVLWTRFSFTFRPQYGYSRGIVAVVARRLESENFGHHIVHVNVLERFDHLRLLERRAVSDKDRSHRFDAVIVAVSSAWRRPRSISLPAGDCPSLIRHHYDIADPGALAVMESRRHILLSVYSHV